MIGNTKRPQTEVREKLKVIRPTELDLPYAENDMVLMSQIAQGNTDAFQTVLDSHMQPVFQFAFSILRDISAAEDVTQETCVRLWNHAQKWTPEGKIRSWLFRIAHNLSIDEIRKRRPHADIDTFAESIADEGASAIQHIEESQVSKVIKAALFCIPVRQRTALMLVHYSDYSNKEAAVTMGISIDALESLLARGRKSLREILNNHKDKLWEG